MPALLSRPLRLAAAVLLVATAACASGPGGGPDDFPGGGGGGRGGRGGGPMGGMGGYGMMANEEVPRDAATIALRFRNELALSDSQVTAFSRIRARFDSTAAPLRRQMDSLYVDLRTVNAGSADERKAATEKARARAGVVRQLKEQVQEVRATVVLALSDRQRQQLQVIEDAMKEDNRPMMGPGGMGGMGGRRGGGMGRPPFGR